MTKRFVKFASLFAVVAMFLGLMVTGCSEGDNTLAESTTAKLVGTIQVATEKSECPKETTYVYMGLMKDGEVIQDSESNYVAGYYSKDGSKYDDIETTQWIGDNPYSMVLPIKGEVVTAYPTADVVIIPADKDGNVLGYYLFKDQKFTKGEPTSCDCTEQELNTATVALRVVGADVTTGEWRVSKGETKAVTGRLVVINKDKQEVFGTPVDVKLSTEETVSQITVDEKNGTITGNEVSEGSKVLVSYEYNVGGTPLSVPIYVTVEGVHVTIACADGVEVPKFAEGEYVVISSVKADGDEKLEYTEVWNEGDTYCIESAALGYGDKNVVIEADRYDKDDNLVGVATGLELDEVTVSAVANEVEVTAWATVQGFNVALDCSATEANLTAGDVVTVKYTIDTVEYDERTLPEYTEEMSQKLNIIPSAKEGDIVKIVYCTRVSGEGESAKTYTAKFDKDNVTVSTTEADNVISVTEWDEVE